MKLATKCAWGIGWFLSVAVFATTCYTDCSSRFPNWYQEPDRMRCQVEKAAACMRPSRLPSPVSHAGHNGKFKQVASRLVDEFQEGGYVVSRKADGSLEHRGDSALWTAIAMSALSCDQGQVFEDALVSSVLRQGGRYIRFEPLPESYKVNETSRDMETGAIFGFAMRARKCPESRAALKRAWKEHRSFVKHEGKLHEGSNLNFIMTPGMDFIWDLVGHEFDLNARPGKASMATFESAIILNATTIAKRKSACYPIHLNTLMLITSARLGLPVTELTKREFCNQTRGMHLPLTEWYCGRAYQSFFSEFKYNEYEYRHQRCPYEGKDGGGGDQTPGVDFLILKSLPEWVGG